MSEEKLIERLIQIRKQHQQVIIDRVIEKIPDNALNNASNKKRNLVVEISLEDDELCLDLEEITDSVVEWCENQGFTITGINYRDDLRGSSFTLSGW